MLTSLQLADRQAWSSELALFHQTMNDEPELFCSCLRLSTSICLDLPRVYSGVSVRHPHTPDFSIVGTSTTATHAIHDSASSPPPPPLSLAIPALHLLLAMRSNVRISAPVLRAICKPAPQRYFSASAGRRAQWGFIGLGQMGTSCAHASSQHGFID